MSSESEHFVRRWSRLKRKSARAGTGSPSARPDSTAASPSNETLSAPDAVGGFNAGAAAPPDVDLSSLPPIEAIAAETDIRGFLRSGVPAELAKAALRRAWSADPAIRDFIGLAENQWDFTDPNAIPGFGSFEAPGGVQDLVNHALNQSSRAAREDGDNVANAASGSESSAHHEAEPAACAPASAARQHDDPVDQGDHGAPQQTRPSPERPLLPNRRSHGRAVPR